MIWFSVAVIVGVVILNTVAWGEGKVNHNAFTGLLLSLALVLSGMGFLTRSITGACEDTLPRNQHCVLVAVPATLK